MEPFVYTSHPARVVFGSGTLGQLGNELDRLGCSASLILSTPGHADQADDLRRQLADRAAGAFSGAAMHTPVEITEQAMAVVGDCSADCIVAIGGGSTIGLGKAIALRTDLPQIAIPTTYAGSEMTDILGQTENGVKTTLRSPKVRPETVIYDVDLTLTLPAALSGTSGLNAIAHAVEGLYARDCNPIVAMMAEEGIRALASALPGLAAAPRDRALRADALYGAWLCGIVLGSVSMALHHKLCHTLGGTFELPHAQTHSILLPHAAAYNALAAPDAMARIARALGADNAPRALYDLARAIGAPAALRDLGMPEQGIDAAADLAGQNPYWNPRPVEPDAIRGLIARAWAGAPPEAG